VVAERQPWPIAGPAGFDSRPVCIESECTSIDIVIRLPGRLSRTRRTIVGINSKSVSMGKPVRSVHNRFAVAAVGRSGTEHSEYFVELILKKNLSEQICRKFEQFLFPSVPMQNTSLLVTVYTVMDREPKKREAYLHKNRNK